MTNCDLKLARGSLSSARGISFGLLVVKACGEIDSNDVIASLQELRQLRWCSQDFSHDAWRTCAKVRRERERERERAFLPLNVRQQGPVIVETSADPVLLGALPQPSSSEGGIAVRRRRRRSCCVIASVNGRECAHQCSDTGRII